MQGMRLIQYFFTLILIVGLGNLISAQEGELYIFGVVKDYDDGKKLENVTIRAYHNGSKVDEYITRSNGKYEFFLELGKEYDLDFVCPGFVSKKVYMDSRNIPAEDIGAGFSMNIEMSLFQELEGLDVSILDQPIGKAKYNPNTGALEFDFAYTQKIKDEISRLMRDYEKGSKDKKAIEEDKEKELQELEREFESLIENADKSFLDAKYQEAVADYKAALELKPDNPMVKMKLKSAEDKLLESNAAKAEQEKYEAALKAGDDLMRTEEFDNAIKKYEEALNIRKDEQYPKEQIDKAKAELAARKKAEEEAARFNDLVRKGDNLVKAMDFSEGISNYNEALSIRPNDQEVKDKIKSAEQALADYESQKALEEQYKALLTEADAKFSSKDYEPAIAKYEEALKVKPEEEYPAKQIEESRRLIDELKKAEEEEKKQQELEAEFNRLVAEGNDQFTAKNYNESIAAYESALVIKPGQKEVEKKISDARAALDKIAEEALLNTQYNEAIQLGDEARKSDQLESALTHFQNAKGLKPDEAYPIDQIAEINKILEERAQQEAEAKAAEEQRKAEEKRLAEELTQFNALVESGDEFFGQKKYQQAIDQYQEALKIKPDNQHIPKKISESQRLLDEMRTQQDKEQNYNEAITEGDRKFKGRNYDGAISAFERALEIKPDEIYPQDQLAAIQAAILEEQRRKEQEAQAEITAQQEAEERAKAEEEAKKRLEFDRIIKLGDELMKEKEYANAKIRYTEALEVISDDPDGLAKLAEADRLMLEHQNQREINKQYNMLIADADAAFGAELYNDALIKYKEALDVKPNELHPKERIKEIDEILMAMERLSEKEREAEREAQRIKEQEEAERLRREKEMSQQAQIDEEYNTLIEVADRKFNVKEYDIALRNYKEALVIKPQEYHPKSRIEEIELLIQEEEKRRLEAERLAQLEKESQKDKPRERRSGNTVDSESEDEAERFMREARLREEAEKYEQIKRMKEQEQNRQLDARESESDRSENYLSQIENFKQQNSDIYETAYDAQQKSSQRMQNFKSAYESGRAEQIEKERKNINRSAEQIGEEKQFVNNLRETGESEHSQKVDEINQQFNDHLDYLIAQRESEDNKSQKAYEKVKEVEQAQKQRQEDFGERQQGVTAQIMQRKSEQLELEQKRLSQESEQIEKAQQAIQEQQEQQTELSRINEKITEDNIREVDQRKTNFREQRERQNEMADQRALKAREELQNLKATAPKEYDDYYLSNLAQDYPQGVTEESDNIGNKVVIRRIVVMGNKADEFRKVIDKTGKYYFKNGNSISELTWNRETNPSYD